MTTEVAAAQLRLTSASQSRRRVPARVAAKPGLRAKVVALAGLLVGASAFAAVRPNYLGFSIHPTTLVIVLLIPFVVARAARFPRTIAIPMAAFFLLFSIACLVPNVAAAEIVKVGCFFATIVVVAVSVDSRREIWRAAVAVAVPLAGISAFTIASGGSGAEDVALDGLGNRNGLSLYTLPAMLLAVAGALERANSRMLRALLWTSAGVIGLSLLARPNRSGWLGALVVVVSFALRDRSRGNRVAVLALAGVVGLILSNTPLLERFQERLQEMAEGRTADRLREELVEQSFSIALEHPLLGVGASELPQQLALRVHGRDDLELIDPHNMFAFVAGAAGFSTLLALFWLLQSLFGFRPAGATRSRTLLVSAVALFAVRGFFTRDVLYSPAFGLLFGLAIGWQLIDFRDWSAARAKGA